MDKWTPRTEPTDRVVFDQAREDVETLRQQLEDLERSIERIRSTVWPKPNMQSAVAPVHIDEDKIRRLIGVRRLCAKQLNEEFFADPAWDILLEAFASELGQRRISVSGLCHMSGVPATTALRWIKKLEQAGWLIRVADASDGRRKWLKLAPDASSRIRSYVEAMWPALLQV